MALNSQKGVPILIFVSITLVTRQVTNAEYVILTSGSSV